MLDPGERLEKLDGDGLAPKDVFGAIDVSKAAFVNQVLDEVARIESDSHDADGIGIVCVSRGTFWPGALR